MEDFGSAEPTDADYIGYKDNCNASEPNNTCVSCSAVTKYYKSLLHPADDTDLPWTGIVFGLTINELWYWCSDQVLYGMFMRIHFIFD